MKVLVIEDNKADQRLLQEMFREMNMPAFELVFAENLTKGIACLDSEDIGVVVLDLGLPESQGLDTFLRLKEHAQNVSVIVLTGLDDTSIALKALKEGAQDYLIKGWISTEILKKSILYAIERQRLLEELRQSNREILFKEERFRTLIENNADAMVVLSKTEGVHYQNPAAELLFEGASAHYLEIPSFSQFEGGTSIERTLDFPSGIQKIIEIRGVPIEWERLPAFLLTIRDITERKRMEEALQRKTRAYKVISECNQFIVKTSDEQDLIKGICNILVTMGGYRCAWVGDARHDKDKTVEPVAQSGFDQEYLKNLRISWKKGRHGKGPTGTAIRTGNPIVIHDIPNNPKCGSWSSEAIRRDYSTVAAFPLIIQKQAIGALTIYSSNPEAFDSEEIQLLSEMTGDLAFGIASIRTTIERKKAEEKIESLAKFPQENPNPIFRISNDGIILFDNRSAEFVVNELRLSVGTKVPEFLEKIVKEGIESGSLLELEKTVGERTYLFTIAPIIGQNYVNLYGIDITERKKAEEELKISLTKYKVLFESFPLAITISDKMGNIIESNRRAVELLGLSTEEQSRRKIDGTEWQLIRSDGTPMPADEYASVRALKENRLVENVEMGVVKGRSAVTWINVTAAPIPLKDYGVAIAYTDITEHKEAEEEMKRSIERFKTVMDGLDALVYVVDMETYNLLFINKHGKDVWGDIEGKVCWQTIQKDQSGPCPFCTNDRLLDSNGNPTGIYHWEFQNTVTHQWYDCRDSAIRWLDGRLVRLEIATDITGHKKAEEHLKHFNEELEKQVAERTEALNKSLHEKDILFKEVHHRVKNNMQIIISLLNLQSRTIDDPVILKTIKDSQSRIRAMALVHERLYQSGDISKIDLKDYIQFLARELFSFYGVKPQLVRFTINAPAINVNIDTAIPVGLMVNELISNAIKYAFPEDRKGEIVIDITKDKNIISLVVRDNGVGIPQDFDWRNAKSLGLRLVISLVEQLQGTIELDRTAGTTFTIVVKEKE